MHPFINRSVQLDDSIWPCAAGWRLMPQPIGTAPYVPVAHNQQQQGIDSGVSSVGSGRVYDITPGYIPQLPPPYRTMKAATSAITRAMKVCDAYEHDVWNDSCGMWAAMVVLGQMQDVEECSEEAIMAAREASVQYMEAGKNPNPAVAAKLCEEGGQYGSDAQHAAVIAPHYIQPVTAAHSMSARGFLWMPCGQWPRHCQSKWQPSACAMGAGVSPSSGQSHGRGVCRHSLARASPTHSRWLWHNWGQGQLAWWQPLHYHSQEVGIPCSRGCRSYYALPLVVHSTQAHLHPKPFN